MLRALPQVQKLLESAEAAALLAEFPRALVTEAVRGALDALRRAVLDGAACFENFPADSFFDSVRSALEPLRHDRMRRVINGTGIVIHTNLGRAPLAEPAVTAIADVAAGYTNLEFDLESGARGSRYAAVTGLLIRGLSVDILAQVGFVVLVGLAAKNAILIVEFARAKESEGADPLAAVLEAARLRLRPILMTSFAFIAGVVPLVLASGAGAEMRHAMGVAVFSGMLGVTFFGLLLTPVFYLVIRAFVEKREARKAVFKEARA